LLPVALTLVTTLEAIFSSRSATTMFTPRVASSIAMPLPRPLAAPVTIAVLPSNSTSQPLPHEKSTVDVQHLTGDV
jgi:hypothetical protein